MSQRAILILLNGIRSSTQLTESSLLRISRGIEIFSGDDVIILSTGFTVNKPPFLDEDGFPIYEASVAGRYLLQNGIPRDQILVENLSKDTIGNAYFSKILHLDQLQITDFVVISSKFHLERVKLIFNWVFNLYCRSPVQYNIGFSSSPDPTYSEREWNVLKAKERDSINNLKVLIPRINSLERFHSWFFSEHLAYAFDKKAPLPNEIVKKLY